jgi:hypothetical protein
MGEHSLDKNIAQTGASTAIGANFGLGFSYNANTVLGQEEKVLLQLGDCPEE